MQEARGCSLYEALFMILRRRLKCPTCELMLPNFVNHIIQRCCHDCSIQRKIMPPSSALSAAGLSFLDLRTLIKVDIEASNELQTRIDRLRRDLKDGRRPPGKEIEELELANKDMTKDLVLRIEKIENAGPLTPADREMLQALNARLTVCDRQGMQLTELRDLEAQFDLREAERIRRESMYQSPLPLGGAPRKPSVVNTVQQPAESNVFPPPPPPFTPPYTPSSFTHSFTPRQGGISVTSSCYARPSSNSPRSSGIRLNELNDHNYNPPSPVDPPRGNPRRSRSQRDRAECRDVPYSPGAAVYGDPRRSNPNLDRPDIRQTPMGSGSSAIYEDPRRSYPNLDRTEPKMAPASSPISNPIYGDPRRSNPSLDRVDSKYAPPSPPIANPVYGDPRRSNPNLDRAESKYVPPSPPIGPRSASSRSNPSPRPSPGRSHPTPTMSSLPTQHRNPSVETVDSKWTPPSPGPGIKPGGPSTYVPSVTSAIRAESAYIHPCNSSTKVESPYFPPPPTQDIREAPYSATSPDSSARRPSSFGIPSPPVASHSAPDYRPPAEQQARRGSNRSGTGEYQFYSYADYSSDEEDDSESVAEWEKTRWPLAYRVLDIDPSLDPRSVQEEAMNALARLSLKHDPARFPNDPDAPARWAAINKAFDVLVHPVRKQNYDIHGNEPQELKEIDVEELKIIDEMR
ncbi:hypothetical protein AC579_3376 [Pseudocercospora musae]|uniref:J domain-containing protein n=1 Tax=Pseudocercospora musae TaxID=113226 RepID=A0A139IL27_9PEZI|nr:hypothetical protein AC579_3376 [Pseudocercospora musae]KXT15483.1 hypothetical protein AC579_3376 [Pseudocercospora musae]